MVDTNVIIPNAITKLQALQDELRCMICQDYFNHAITLSCSHTFCLRCISMWLIIRPVCPICRQETTVVTPSESLDNMVATLSGYKKAQDLEDENLEDVNISNIRCKRLLEKLVAYVEAFSRYRMHLEVDEIMLQQFHIVRGELLDDGQIVETETEMDYEEHEGQTQEENEGYEEHDELMEGVEEEERVEEEEEEHEERVEEDDYEEEDGENRVEDEEHEETEDYISEIENEELYNEIFGYDWYDEYDYLYERYG